MTAEPKKTGARHPWRDNLEAVTMAIAMAVMLKYFVVEAYKIPTGSMQPTLLGASWDSDGDGRIDNGIYDRIIVDKFSYHYRDPERWEVAVFKYPLDRSKNFIKRICGMPGEQLRIEGGDLWTRASSAEAWKVLRKPRPIQREMWKPFDRRSERYSEWRKLPGAEAWLVEGRSRVVARGDGGVRLPRDGGAVLDAYRDGYPADLARWMNPSPGSHPVGDLRVDGEVTALAGCRALVVELREGARRYQLVLPGPAAPEGSGPRIAVEEPSDGGQSGKASASATPWRLPAGEAVSFAAQNMDDLLSLEVDGEVVAELEIAPAEDATATITLRVEGEGADLDDLEAYRDIHYTESVAGSSEFTIPPDSYVMLGDNTQDSSDSREWQFVHYRWPASDGDVRGNFRGQNENPQTVVGGPEGPRIFLRDEWGELHDFLARDAQQGHQRELAPFVPRHLITGRALVVFWPLTALWPPNWFDRTTPIVWRLKWIR